ncbi:MAG: GAF domain-containing protein [Desertifilum sp.]|nr:GAF domain-containing protein [Oscillatoria laete-virens]MCD8487614.1 GAF domain-containing protein [Desertifilum sp.]
MPTPLNSLKMYWQQTERERLMLKMQQRICQSLDLEEILQMTVQDVREFLQTDRVAIYRFESDGQGMLAAKSLASGWELPETEASLFQKYVQPYQNCGLDALIESSESVLVEPSEELLAQFQIQAHLAIPIFRGEKLWGLLIAHHCRSPRQWQQPEIDLLAALAMQLAIAIQQSELYQQVQQLNSQLEAQVQERTAQLQKALEFEAMLKLITDKVRDSLLDETQIWYTAVRELTQVLNLKGCNAALYDLGQGTSTVCSEFVKTDEDKKIPPIYGRVQELGKFPELYCQLLQGEYFQFCSLLINKDRGPVSMLVCPIFDDRGVLGDLWLVNDAAYEFSEREIRLVQQVATQCAIAIRQARLFQASVAQVEELARINRLKDDFLSAVPHELRTPVTNMKMAIHNLSTMALSNLIVSTNEQNQKRIAHYLQILQYECEREISLINDLLDLQRLDTRDQPLSLEPINLSEFLPQVIKPFQVRANNRQQSLQLEMPLDLPILCSNAPGLERILAELLNNACKYTPPGEQIIVAVSVQSSNLLFQITNTGVEIAPSERSRIFDKFYRIPRADPWKQGGTGLGLALVKKLTEHLGGLIEVGSSNGKTCFSVFLPLHSELNSTVG